MNDPKSLLGRLPSSWQAAIQAQELHTSTVPMEQRKKCGRQVLHDSEAHLHSSELHTLIARLKRERIRRGLSLRDVAQVTDQARSAISRLENGQYPNPTLDTVYRYAFAIGMRITLTAEPQITHLIADSDSDRMRPSGS